MSFAARLREARQRAGLTQAELAQRLGYSGRSAVNEWESGRRAPPLKEIEKLAQVLGVGACWLAFGEKE